MRTRLITMVLGLFVMLVACGETTEPSNVNRVAPQRPHHYEEVGSQDPPEGAGAEYQQSTTMDLESDAGFTEEYREGYQAPNDIAFFAYGQAILNYSSTDAEASVDISVRKGGSVVASNSSGSVSDSHIFPTSTGFAANTNAEVFAACGHSNQATTHGHVWNKALINLSWLSWGDKQDSGTRTGDQDACQPGLPGGGSTPPSGDPGNGCHWARDFVVYDDGSWQWLTDWYAECGAEERSPNAPTRAPRTTSSNGRSTSLAPAGPPARALLVRLLGTAVERPGRAIAAYRDVESDADVIVKIDTARATPADLTSALRTIPELYDSPSFGHRAVLGVISGGPSALDRSNAQPGSKAEAYLHQLLTAAEKSQRRLGRGRVIDLLIDPASRSLP